MYLAQMYRNCTEDKPRHVDLQSVHNVIKTLSNYYAVFDTWNFGSTPIRIQYALSSKDTWILKTKNVQGRALDDEPELSILRFLNLG